jgi:biopolymer transport protein TolQ
MTLDTVANVWTMISELGPVVHLILIILVIFSLLCWTIILAKIRLFHQARRSNEDFEELFWESSDLNQIYGHARRMSKAPMAGVFLEGYRELRRLKEYPRTQNPSMDLKLWLETLERSLDKGIRKEMASLEHTLPFLATTGNVTPFIGLFGTVWGIMRTFHSIGLRGSASLATVAPGISEALVATAAGLAAAIPAVIAFNGFMSWMARQEVQLHGFAGDFLNIIERQLIQGKKTAQGPE